MSQTQLTYWLGVIYLSSRRVLAPVFGPSSGHIYLWPEDGPKTGAETCHQLK